MYSVELYIGIITSIYFALAILVTLILLMKSVNGTQFLYITPLFLSSARFPASLSPISLIVIVPLTNMYASLQSYKFDLTIDVLNLI